MRLEIHYFQEKFSYKLCNFPLDEALLTIDEQSFWELNIFPI